MRLKVGERVGPYRLVAEIARGNVGIVFEGQDERDGRDVALKVLQRVTGEGALERFRREVRSLEALRHHGIVAVLGGGAHRGAPYVVMELLRGGDFAQRLDRDGPLPIAEAAEVVRELARCVQHAHEQGILHRDLKPSNVIASPRGPVLTDFGLARAVDLEQETRRLSASGVMLGTPSYWAPEQARGRRDQVGVETDVYGLGGTLYALLTGEPPQEGSSLIALLASLDRPPTAPSRLRPEIDPSLEEIVLRCLERDPRDRYPSAAALVAALDGYLGDADPVAARPRRRLFAALVGGALALPLLALPWLASPSSPGRVGEGTAVDKRPALAPAPRPSAQESALAAAWREGLDAERQGDWEVARRRFDRVVELEPEHVAALWRRARLENYRSGDMRSAADDCEMALRVDPGCVEAQIHSAWARFWSRPTEVDVRAAAVSELEGVIAVRPELLDAYLARAVIHRFLGEREPAQALLERVLAADPEHGQALHDLAWVRRNQKRYHEALGLCARAKRAQPRRLDVYRLSGDMKRMTGDLSGALADLLKVAEQAPDERSSWGNLSVLYMTLGRWQDALGCMAQLARLGEELPSMLRRRGICHLNLGDLGRALLDLERSVEGHEAAVRAGADRRATLRADELDAYLYLGVTHARAGRLSAAEDAFARAAEVLPEGSQQRAEALRLLRTTRAQQGKAGE